MTHLKGILKKSYGTKSPVILTSHLRQEIIDAAMHFFQMNSVGRDPMNIFWNATPYVPDLDKKIYEQVKQEPISLYMGWWHTRNSFSKEENELHTEYIDDTYEEGLKEARECGTSHCMAGWACVLAGKKGYELENALGPEAAGALIFAKSTGSIPDFCASNEVALKELKKRAGVRVKKKVSKKKATRK